MNEQARKSTPSTSAASPADGRAEAPANRTARWSGKTIGLLAIGALFAVAFVFARELVQLLEQLGVLARRGLVFNTASDFAFASVVVSIALTVFAVIQGARALAGKLRASVRSAEDDPRYADLLRQKEMLLREIKELELDRDLRKIEGEDFVLVERRLREKALVILRALDELDPLHLYAARIEADLAPLLPSSKAADENLDLGGDAFRAEVMARPHYRELAHALGERELLLLSLRGYTVVAADIDRGALSQSRLTVTEHGKDGEQTVTLGELRARVLAALRTGTGRVALDDAEAFRLAWLAGIKARRESGELRVERAGAWAASTPEELRGLALERLSRELTVGVAA